MAESDWLAERFEQDRTRLRAVAYRMLGSFAEAEDAVQEAWLRASKSDASSVDNLGAWLTTIVARVCLNALRSRRARREEPMGVHVPDPVISNAEGTSPEDEVLLADAVGMALQIVLDTLTPAERLAFVLHDMFGLSFDEIAPVVGRSPATARQLASRARRRVQGADVHAPDADIASQRAVVDAFFAAAHRGDLDALVAVLDPDVVNRVDFGSGVIQELRGAEAVAGQARMYSRLGLVSRPALVNGAIGVVSIQDGRPFSVGGFTVRDGRIVEMDWLADPDRLAQLDLTIVAG